MRRESLAVFVAALVGLGLRARVAYQGSIWADEGSFLNVIAAPTWRGMIAFLTLHESHPPLFYVFMRAWSQFVGSDDRALLFAPVLIGSAIIPAMYIAGRNLFSSRVGVIAAWMAALAPQLVEHASQLRPYGLLSLCVLGSVASLAAFITNGTRRTWIIYVLSTAAMLYTHNWGWMIVAGEFCAALLSVRHRSREVRKQLALNALVSWAAILILYSPWVSSLVFQSTHAGHGSLPLENLSEYVGYVVFSVNVILESLILGRLADRENVAVTAMIGAAILVGWTTVRYARDNDALKSESRASIALFVFSVGVFALLSALVVSPLNNLILPRGVASVTPMLLLGFANLVDAIVCRRVSRASAQLGAVLFGFALIAAAFETAAIVSRPRSNAGKIAENVKANARPDDLLIVAPEWFAASFDHYFPSSIEQIDYPYDSRAAMIDFANVWKTRTQSGAVERINRRVEKARASKRRVWFVFERRYTREFSQEELAKAFRHQQPGAFSVQDVRRIRATLNNLYGPPQRTFEANDPIPINDDLVAYLYAR